MIACGLSRTHIAVAGLVAAYRPQSRALAQSRFTELRRKRVTTMQAQSDERRWRMTVWIIVTAVTAALVAFVIQAEPLASANDRSRWCTVWSLVERGTYQIDEIQERPGWSTIDLVRHEGHFYSSKPALLPTLVAGLYWLLRAATGWTLLGETQWVTSSLLILINVVPYAVALLVLGRTLERETSRPFTRLFILVTAAVGTLLTPFLTTFNNHTIAATSALWALSALLRITEDKQDASWGLYAVAGFFAAFTCVNELPAALFGIVAFLMCVVQSNRKTWLAFVPCALIPLAGFFVTTWISTGGWKPFYLYYGTDKYEYVHEGVPSYWTNPTGIDRPRDGFLTYLLHCTIGHHGILSLTPVFLLTLAGWFSLRRGVLERTARALALRRSLQIGFGLTLAILAFYLSRPQNYNYGGNTSGLRWTFWLIPFWLLALIPALDRINGRAGRTAALLLLGVSVYSSMSVIENPWQQPWLFNLMTRWGWIDYSDPPPEFDVPLTCWITQLPEPNTSANSTDDPAPYWVEFTGPNVAGQLIRVRLERISRPPDAETDEVWVRMTYRAGAAETFDAEFGISRAAVAEQRSVHEIIRWPEDVDNSVRNAAQTLLHGVPYTRDSRIRYTRYLVRYVNSPIRVDAFACRRTAAQRTFAVDALATKLAYRADFWLSDAVPFGLVRLQRTVTDENTGDILGRLDLLLTDASPLAEDVTTSDQDSSTTTKAE